MPRGRFKTEGKPADHAIPATLVDELETVRAQSFGIWDDSGEHPQLKQLTRIPFWVKGRGPTSNQPGEASREALYTVELMAAHGKLKKVIAAFFGIKWDTFQKYLLANKGDNPLSLAWESGRAIHEESWGALLRDMATGSSKGATIAAIFYAKSQFGWHDRPADTTNTGPVVNLLLPGSMSREDYYRKLGIARPLQPGEMPPMEAIEPPRDVTPALPAPGNVMASDAVQKALDKVRVDR